MSRSHGREGINFGGWPDFLFPLSSQEQVNAAQGDGERQPKGNRVTSSRGYLPITRREDD